MLTSQLAALAEFHGLQLSYYDVLGHPHTASAESLMAVLRALGIPVEHPDQAGDLLTDARLAAARRLLEPVTVAWEKAPASFWLRLPQDLTDEVISCRLRTEDGAIHAWSVRAFQFLESKVRNVDGYRCIEARIAIAAEMPAGYHQLEVTVGGRDATALVVCAPAVAFAPTGAAARRWGVFLPLYALHSAFSWGAGDFTDLATLSEWVSDQGGSLVATLPLLASFFDGVEDESPYRPASRLFWNEFYLDVARIPELETCAAARAVLQSPELRGEREQLRAAELVEYRPQMQLKRRVLEELARHFFENPSPRHDDFEQFVRRVPDVDSYARFRAAQVCHGRDWARWPEALRAGEIGADDFDRRTWEYHLYVQWLVDDQLRMLSRQAESLGMTWYLDLPLGVHPEGFDAWRHRDAYALQASGGAPPDRFFREGQFWDFPPLHPRRLRDQGYRHFVAVLRTHLRFAKLLRIDHVMGLYRLYWVPRGLKASEGVYVRYPADELFAIVTLESQRHRARIIGENLGTVPNEVVEAMNRHRIGRLHVLQFECHDDRRRALSAPAANTVASLNTHDTPPFAAFWQGLDIDDRLEMKLLDEREAQGEREHRGRVRQAVVAFLHDRGMLDSDVEDLPAVLEACLAFLSQSDAEVVLVNLEDLGLETASQNTPGTITERINWRRKTRSTLEQIRQQAMVLDVLRRVDRLRKSHE